MINRSQLAITLICSHDRESWRSPVTSIVFKINPPSKKISAGLDSRGLIEEEG
jgi:hypothetical protein